MSKTGIQTSNEKNADDEVAPAPPRAQDQPRTAVLVGNPNVGKSLLFGALTGKYVTVSNYPGTTVEVMEGKMSARGTTWRLLDTPGTNSLWPLSEDEQVTRDVLVKGEGQVCVQVADAKNLRRALLLTLELAEAGVPLVLVLNMMDEAEARGLRIDDDALSLALGVEVIRTVAAERKGLGALRQALEQARPVTLQPHLGAALEEAVGPVEAELGRLPPAPVSRRALALMLLVGDPALAARLRAPLGPEACARIDAVGRRLAAEHDESLRATLARERLSQVDRLLDAVVSRESLAPGRSSPMLGRLARWTTHPLWGVPVLLAVLAACYGLVGVIGANWLVDFFQKTLFHGYLLPFLDGLVRALVPSAAVQEFLVGPAQVPLREHGGLLIGRYGLVSMGLGYGLTIVLPIIAAFFFVFSLLEDSGYLPRLAVMADRLFRRLGLNGKAVLPMVLGLGCDTMATMTARIMPTRKERLIVTLLLALAIPCSAQLAVILAMIGGIHLGAALWFAGTMLAVLLVVGWLAAKVIPGRGSDFILELPPLRVPKLGNIAVKTVARVEWYLREALPLFLLGTLILYLLDAVRGLAVLERAAAPIVVGVLGLPREVAGALILGFLRRDYAAAGLFARYQPFMQEGTLTRAMEIEVVVGLVTVTLFLPCIANLFIIIKERGWKTATAIMCFILPFSIAVGGLVRVLMGWLYR